MNKELLETMTADKARKLAKQNPEYFEELSTILEAIEKTAKNGEHLLIWKDTIKAEVAVSLEDRGFILQSGFDKEIAFTYYIRW